MVQPPNKRPRLSSSLSSHGIPSEALRKDKPEIISSENTSPRGTDTDRPSRAVLVNGCKTRARHDDLPTPIDVVEPPPNHNPSFQTGRPAQSEFRTRVVKVLCVENDRKPSSLVILTGLKSLFQSFLPEMPRGYIARLVYDPNSRSLAIVKNGYRVVAGICFRPFPHRGFVEIAFLATANQGQGYGSMLMNHFKTYLSQTYPGTNHILTCADNAAVGYFRKQGFFTEISLEPSVWMGYVKDYQGTTFMQCTLLPKVDYLVAPDIISKQMNAILSKITEKSKSHIVYPGLDWWKKGNTTPIEPKDVPGLREWMTSPTIEYALIDGSEGESGWQSVVTLWTPPFAGTNPKQVAMKRLLRSLRKHPKAWPFMEPVKEAEVPDYYTYIKQPMDFATMGDKLEMNQYAALSDFVADVHLVFENCKWYNAQDSPYHQAAIELERFFHSQLRALKARIRLQTMSQPSD